MFKRMPVPVAAAAVLLSGLLAYQLFAPKGERQDWTLRPNDAALVAQGRTLYTSQCASCHGADLEGEENWRARKADGRLPAPPHDESGHTWHHPDEALFTLTKYGLQSVAGADYESDMPAFEGILTDDEIVAVLSYIKSRWPDDVRATHDEINRRAKTD